MTCENCEDCQEKKSNPADVKIHYAMVRIESDKPISEVKEQIEKIENDISILTRIDVMQLATITAVEEDDVGSPIMYWP